MTPFARPLIGLAILIPVGVSATTLGGYPSEETCASARTESYVQGFAAGDTNGYNRGYPDGYFAGTVAQTAICADDPQSCGITLDSCIPDASFGETEPNDSAITADLLTAGANYWGQSYGGADQDWFYTQTTSRNQNIIVNFSVPEWMEGADLASGLPAIWNLSIRDAAGNVFANYYTNFAGSVKASARSVTYSVTLGLAGTYYVVVQPADKTIQNAYSYSIAAFIQDTGLDNDQPIAGFYDTEIEPNDVPSRSTPLATTVTMYGLINLTFNVALPTVDDTTSTYVWGQGEDDWYVYKSNGNEMITLTLCSREACGPGNWFIEVYDQATAERWEAGESRDQLKPMLSFNTDTVDDANRTFPLGLKDPGYYFMRVNHKRLFTAPCLAQQFVSTTSESHFTGFCECADGENSCSVPADCSNSELGLVCNSVPADCVVGIEPGCDYIPDTPPGCGVADADGNITQCDTYQTQARCSCSQYGGVVEVPANEYTSPYNFTWQSTQLSPNTIDTDAYQDFLDRPTPY